MDLYERFTKKTRKKIKKDYWETSGPKSSRYKNREDEGDRTLEEEDQQRNESLGESDLRERRR